MSNNSSNNYFVVFDNEHYDEIYENKQPACHYKKDDYKKESQTDSCTSKCSINGNEDYSKNICGYNNKKEESYENYYKCHEEKEDNLHKNPCGCNDKREINSYEEYCKCRGDIDVKPHKNNCNCYPKKEEESYEDHFRKCKCDYESSKNHKE